MKCLLVLLLAASNVVFVPSGILATPKRFDRQNVTVMGTVESLSVHGTGPRTFFTAFQLCDSQCINVINPGVPNVVTGKTARVNGTFYTFFARGPVRMHDVIVVDAQ